MELITVPKRRNFNRCHVHLLRVSTTEAVRIIHSLTEQVLRQSPNAGRWECFLKDGSDFSIAVHHEPLERVPLSQIR